MDDKNLERRAKRDHGAGSISQRADGTWTARLQVGYNANGKPNIKAFYGKKESEVKAKLKAFQKELYKNDFTVVQKTTVQKYMESWLISVKKNTLKPKSYDRLETTLKYQVYPSIGNLQIGAVTSDNIQNMVNKLRDDGKSYSTIKKAYDAVNDCFRTGVIKKSVAFNPALGVTLPVNIKKDSSDIKYLSRDEFTRIITEATRTHGNGTPIFRLGYVVPFALNTGLRISEILGLKWAHVDFQNKTISIEDTIVSVRNREENAATKYKLEDQSSTKSRSGQRIISLNSKAYEALTKVKEITGNSQYVFASKSGKPLSPRNIDRLLRNASERAGLPQERILGCHALRHTFASMLFAKQVDVKIVSEILGHSSIKITYDTYIHLIEDQKTKAVEAIEDF